VLIVIVMCDVYSGVGSGLDIDIALLCGGNELTSVVVWISPILELQNVMMCV